MARLGVGIGLVGRRRELSALTDALDRAVAGRPTGVLLSGDAGVGKSRLVTEAAQRASAAGFTVLIGHCMDSAGSLPYLPFTEIVGGLAAASPELLDAHAELGRLLPGSRPTADLAAEDRELGQLRVFDAVLSALCELAAESPALLVVEDLHWADRSSRDLLVFLLSRLSTQRLVVLASFRSDDVHRRHPLRPVLSELVRLPAVERVELAPLDAVDALDLVRRLADGTLAEPMLHRVAERSEGNAFFAEELVSASSDGLPHGLAEVLMARIDGLPAGAQHVLRVASVGGRRVRHNRLAAVAGLPQGELEQALRDAVTHHVLVSEQSGVGDALVFRHALLREAIYHELLPGERSRLHAGFAELLARSPDGPGVAAELAEHALAGHDLPRALAASVRAAQEANDREAPAEVLLHAERAIDLWNAVPAAEAVAGVDEGTLTRWAAWGASATGDPDRGIALARRALELADERGDPVLSASIGRRYAMRLLELSGHEQEALDVSLRALDLVADGPPSADLAWAHAILARVLCGLERWPEAAETAETALGVAASVPADPSPQDLGPQDLGPQDLGAVGATADALVTLAICEERAGHPERARQRLAQAIPLAGRSANLGVELRAHYSAGLSLLDEGRLAEAGDEFAAGEARAADTGITWSGYGLDLRVAHVIARYMRGDWDAAEAAAELAGESVSATVASRLAAAGLLTAVGRGRLEAVGRRVAELQASHPADEQVIMLLGQAGAEAALWEGQPDEAARRVEDALAGLNAVIPFQLGSIMLAALGVAAQVDLASTGAVPHADAVVAARALVAVAEQTAARGKPRAGTLGPEGDAWLCRARAELTRLTGPPDPHAWSGVIEAFGYETGGYETGGYETGGYETGGNGAGGNETGRGGADGNGADGNGADGNGADGNGADGNRADGNRADGNRTGCGGAGYRQAYARLRRAEATLGGHPARDTAAHAAAALDLRVAAATAQRLGALPLAGAVRALAERAGVRLDGTSAPRVAPDILTPRERSVLALVAGGRTNRQVGALLFISEKTVSVHLSRVMAKLGAGSRTEAVTVAYARGLLAPGDQELARPSP